MKKESLQFRFIELRALGYTYKKICTELEISNPTAIKWGKLLASEINKQQKYLMANIFSQKIVEQEQGIMIKLEQFRRAKGMNLPKRVKDKMDKQILNELEKIFAKRIRAVHLKLKDDYVANAIFIFDDDVVVRAQEGSH